MTDTVTRSAPADPNWAARAACRGGRPDVPEDAWMPDKNTRNTPQVRAALLICRTICPVAADCYLHGVLHDEPGIWGGVHEWDRPNANA